MHLKAWCDASSYGSSNPKKARIGVGVVWCENGEWFEHHRAAGRGDCNRGELLAIRETLLVIKERHPETVHEITLSLFSDSEYARLALMTRTFVSPYIRMVAAIKSLESEYKAVHRHWVKGHSGCAANCRADYWAGVASGKNARPEKSSRAM